MSAPPTTIRPPSIRALTGEHFAARPDTIYFSQQALRLVVVSEHNGAINATTRLLRRGADNFVPQTVSNDTALEFLQ